MESLKVGPSPGPPSLLIVATVSGTIRNFLVPYARHFRSLGWRVDAAANGCTIDAAVSAAFDHVYELPLSRSILSARAIARGERAMEQILESRPDIVHVHTPIASFVARMAVRRVPAERRPKVAYTAHGFHFHQGGGRVTNEVFLTAERVAGRWTDRLVVINDEDFEAARQHHIVRRNRLVRMPGIGVDTETYSRSSVDPEAIAAVRQGFDLPSNVPLFVVVAELSKRKRNADVIAALSMMRHRGAALLILGQGPERERLEALAASRGVEDRVRFGGFIDDVRPIVAGATALVLASDREGLARAIMEALALEVPVIASTARGNAELLGADSGVLVPTGDVAGFAEAMDGLVGQPDVGRRMGARGRARMVARYGLAQPSSCTSTCTPRCSPREGTTPPEGTPAGASGRRSGEVGGPFRGAVVVHRRNPRVGAVDPKAAVRVAQVLLCAVPVSSIVRGAKRISQWPDGRVAPSLPPCPERDHG
jgi:Glycosyltransferase